MSDLYSVLNYAGQRFTLDGQEYEVKSNDGRDLHATKIDSATGLAKRGRPKKFTLANVVHLLKVPEDKPLELKEEVTIIPNVENTENTPLDDGGCIPLD